MQTNTNKLLAGALVAGMVLATTGAYAATNIGTGSVVGSGALTTNVVWNDTYTTNSATGAVNGIVVKARVKPSLNMVITGSGVIDLGDVDPAAYSSGSVDIEVGTNAVNGASVTAKSTNGGLQNASDATQLINSATTVNDPVADSYQFSSAILATADSAFTMTQSAMAAVEVNNTTTAHPIYTSNKPQSLSVGTDDFTFTVAAKPDAQTPAGEYNDVVVLTVTGNF